MQHIEFWYVSEIGMEAKTFKGKSLWQSLINYEGIFL